jgi:hypothetical protein
LTIVAMVIDENDPMYGPAVRRKRIRRSEVVEIDLSRPGRVAASKNSSGALPGVYASGIR